MGGGAAKYVVVALLALLVTLAVGTGVVAADPGEETPLNNSTRVNWQKTLVAESYDVNPSFDSNSNVYIATNGPPELKRIDPTDGSDVWQFAPSTSAFAFRGPAIHGDTVYVAATTFEKDPGQATLYAVDTNGTERWRVDLTARYGAVNVWYRLRSDEAGNVYFVIDDVGSSFFQSTTRYLVSYAPNGTERFKTPLWSGVRNPRIVTVDDGTVVLSGKNAARVDADTGSVLAETSTPYGTLVSRPTVSGDGEVFYDANYATNTLYAVYTDNLSTKWTSDVSAYTNGTAWTTPSPGPGGYLYWFGNPSNRDNPGDELATDLVVLHERNGSVARTVNLTMDAPAKNAPLVRSDGRAYVLTNDNELLAATPNGQAYEIDAPEQTGQWQAGFTPPVLGPDGRLYFGYTETFDGQTRLVQLDPDPLNRIVDSFEDPTTLSADENFSVFGASSSAVRIRDDVPAAFGTRAVYVGDVGADGGGIVSRSLDTRGASVVVSWQVKQSLVAASPDVNSNEDLVVEYRDADGNWVEVARYRANGTNTPYVFGRVELTAASARHDDFAVRFRQPSATATDPWLVDAVCVLPRGGPCPYRDGSPPTIAAPTLIDATDGDGDVTDGDVVTVSADIADGETGVATVTANVSALGGPRSLVLTDGDGDGTYDATFTVGAAGSPRLGPQSARIVAADGVGNTANATTNQLRVFDLTYVDEFDDETRPADEPGENETIPPTDGNEEGDVRRFTNARAANGTAATLVEAPICIPFFGCFELYNLNVGFAVRDVPNGSVQQVTIRYALNGSSADAEDLTFDVVDADGNDVDATTSYDLPSPSGGGTATVTVTLSTAETQYLNDGGTLYLVVEDANPNDGTVTEYEVFFVRVRTSD